MTNSGVLVILLALFSCAPEPISNTSAQSPQPGVSPTPLETESPPPAGPAVVPATVERVVDGDTIELDYQGTLTKVRLIGVDTPESTIRHDPYGSEASEYTRTALGGANVYLETDLGDRDRFGRLLAYVWTGPPATGDDADVRANMFNAKLVLSGYAQVLTVPPNVKYVDKFIVYQTEARDSNAGLWGLKLATPFRTPPRSKSSSPPAKAGNNCDPSYPDVCIPPPPPDLDCGEISYRDFRVVGSDPHGFDRDKDGVGCET